MRMHFFAIPALNPESASSELASFLASHRVLAVDRQFVSDGSASFWAICVAYQQATSSPRSRKRTPVDYREQLSADDFAMYAKLRDLRKTLAQREAIPPYAIFTNEQLAAIATQRPKTTQALAALPGVGEARLGKYGAQVLDLVRPTASKPTKQELRDAPAQ